jgi:LacI family transcriptional regulator
MFVVIAQNRNNRVTIDDVAQQAGVSTATVSRYLNSPDKVASTTAARVQTAIRTLGYQPNTAARMLVTRKTNAIGLIVDEIKGEFFQPMLRGIEIATSRASLDLVIHSTRRISKVGTYPLGEHNTDGLVVFADSLPDEELRRLYRVGFPLVLLHRSSPHGLHIPCVTVENKGGARQMMDYLIEVRGYRRIAFLAGPESHEDSHWRELGYREALAAHDIDFDPRLIGQGEFSEDRARETVTQWLRRGLHMQAIFAADDDSAIGAMFAIKEAGRRVPHDVAVVGFDDIRLARYLSPPLTTVRAPIEKAAQIAVEQLIRLINTGKAEPLTLLPTELVIRESCGCC